MNQKDAKLKAKLNGGYLGLIDTGLKKSCARCGRTGHVFVYPVSGVMRLLVVWTGSRFDSVSLDDTLDPLMACGC